MYYGEHIRIVSEAPYHRGEEETVSEVQASKQDADVYTSSIVTVCARKADRTGIDSINIIQSDSLYM
jgi:hypothetical protein